MQLSDFFTQGDFSQSYCQVYQYTVSHSSLCIQLSSGSKPTYLYFGNVIYFSGPFGWKGGNFSVATHHELLELGSRARLFDDLDSEGIIDVYKLYYVLDNDVKIEIVASDFYYSSLSPYQ